MAEILSDLYNLSLLILAAFVTPTVRNPTVHQSSEHLHTSCDKTMASNPNCKGNHERSLSEIYFPITTYIT